MSFDDLRARLARVADARLARRADDTADAAIREDAAAPAIGGFRVGDRVFDLRGGEEGSVFNVGTSARTGDPAISIRFDDGGIAIRRPLDLLARPRPPAARA